MNVIENMLFRMSLPSYRLLTTSGPGGEVHFPCGMTMRSFKKSAVIDFATRTEGGQEP